MKKCGVKVFARHILKGIFRDEINSDQTLLKFSFNSALQDDSSEKIPVSQGVADG